MEKGDQPRSLRPCGILSAEQMFELGLSDPHSDFSDNPTPQRQSMGHVHKGVVCPALLGWAKGFGAHCQSLLEAAAVQEPLAVETLALSFKAVCIHWLPAGLSRLLQGLFPVVSRAGHCCPHCWPWH